MYQCKSQKRHTYSLRSLKNCEMPFCIILLNETDIFYNDSFLNGILWCSLPGMQFNDISTASQAGWTPLDLKEPSGLETIPSPVNPPLNRQPSTYCRQPQMPSDALIWWDMATCWSKTHVSMLSDQQVRPEFVSAWIPPQVCKFCFSGRAAKQDFVCVSVHVHLCWTIMHFRLRICRCSAI